MNIAVNELAVSVCKKPLTECSIAELKELAHQYPWFAPVQILYAKKLQPGDPSLYEDQVQKTSLYFQNRLWLHHLLNENGSVEIITPAPSATEENTVAEEDKPAIAEVIEEPLEEPVTQTEINEPVEAFTHAAPIEEERMLVENTEEYKPVIPEIVDEQTKEAGAAEAVKEEPAVETVTEPFLEIPKLKIHPVNIMNAPLAFEPYHTIDYFASQGIKFREEDKPKDRFDQQLKSFTEWLKAMKRVPASEITAAATDPGSEKKVEQMAEHSLAERHVVTEAMAEVWIKQGNKAKAEEIYRKLSLLDPPKTAYFAAKIDELKKTS